MSHQPGDKKALKRKVLAEVIRRLRLRIGKKGKPAKGEGDDESEAKESKKAS